MYLSVCHPPAWMMSLAHSLHGKSATYMVQPFTSALFLFIMALSSAWHTGGVLVYMACYDNVG